MNLTRVPNLNKIILELLNQIPSGRLTTYKDIAVALGDERAARAVGVVMAGNEAPHRYPCWKVVHSSGDVGKYSGGGGRPRKIELMEEEGINISDGKVVNFDSVRFSEFKLEPPLNELREIQSVVRRRYEEVPLSREFDGFAGGVDLSYGEGVTVASYVECHEESHEPIYEDVIDMEPVKFPYIPGYWAFRELNPMIKQLRRVKQERGLPNLIFVDGNGRLHPRKAGLATHLGVVLNHPTIGVAKKLLCGRRTKELDKVGQLEPIRVGDEQLGVAVKTYSPANPIYVSVGHKVSLTEAADLAVKFSKFKLPEPLRLAHKRAKRRATS